MSVLLFDTHAEVSLAIIPSLNFSAGLQLGPRQVGISPRQCGLRCGLCYVSCALMHFVLGNSPSSDLCRPTCSLASFQSTDKQTTTCCWHCYVQPTALPLK